jgi:putative endopeptidase
MATVSIGSASRLAVLVIACAMAACARAPEDKPEAATPAAAKPAQPGGIDVAGMDRSVAPGDDFFAFANGTWAKTTEIPADRSSYGVWAVLSDRAQTRTRELIEGLAKAGANPSGDDRKIADYFTSYMDEATIESKGLTPVQPFLAKIAAIQDRTALAAWVCSTLRTDVDALNATNFYTDHVFGVWISPALDDPTMYVPYLLQGGLGMPDRDYYLEPGKEMEQTRGAYRDHVVNVLRLANVADPDKVAERIIALETKIARVHATRTDSADVMKGNNPWPRAEFAKRAPGFDWNTCFDTAGLSHADRFIVWHPGAVRGIAALLEKEPIDTWREYLEFHALDRYSGLLPKAFADEHFAFYGKALSGTEEQRPRWKRAVDSTSDSLGDAVGQLYVKKYFSPQSKQQLQAMVKDLVAAFERRISALDWMNPQTKENARAKLGTLKVGIGYPETWRDYSKLEIVPGEALMNAWRAELYDYELNRAKLSQPVNRAEWAMTPQTVNALNLPVLNALNFPAAILEPPFFDPTASIAVNYGAIGAIVGHEISHSFDDQGSQFDASGKLRNWWTKEDFAHFKTTAAKLVAQYNAYVPLPDLHVNGQLTLSENIADLAGLNAAYDAYRQATAGGAKTSPPAGFTSDQEFFISFGQAWRSKMREALLRQLILTDGHAPDQFRAATVRNLDPWYDAFQVKEGQRLFLSPADRVRVW